MTDLGIEMHELCKRLFPLNRSITGSGVRETLTIIKEYLPDLRIEEIPSGTRAFDWIIPREWNVREAYVTDPNGRRILDFRENNLHLVGYSIPVDATLSLEDLQPHLHSVPEMPKAVPYVTSYYEERWGFCISHELREKLIPGDYHVVIDSVLKDGSLTYGDLILPGESDQEVFLSTYVCHPSMANNELSGPVVTTFLAKRILSVPRRHFTYRIVFIPETIGSIVYLSRNYTAMEERIVAGFNVTCIGDDRAYSFLPSRGGDTLADRVAMHVLKHTHPDFIRYSFLQRGSDERQYCSPGIDLPVATVMRSKYGEYPEYHTSLDDLNLVTPSGLYGGYEVLERCLACIEADEVLRCTVLCEPQLGRRGLYPTLSTRERDQTVQAMMNLIAYCDGERSLLEIAEIIDMPMWELIPIANKLKEFGVLTSVSKW
jgi:aminopeptidase-like protein